jgi:hypothetical protein
MQETHCSHSMHIKDKKNMHAVSHKDVRKARARVVNPGQSGVYLPTTCTRSQGGLRDRWTLLSARRTCCSGRLHSKTCSSPGLSVTAQISMRSKPGTWLSVALFGLHMVAKQSHVH